MVLVSLVQLLAVYISLKVIDRVGRKKLILNGQGFIIACLLGIFVFNKLLSGLLP